MKHRLPYWLLLTVLFASSNFAGAQDTADCVFLHANSYQVTLQVIDRTQARRTAPANYKTSNIYAWLDSQLKMQNPRQPEGWWYPMYADNGIIGGLGEASDKGDSIVWTLTLDVFPGVYKWNPGARQSGMHALTKNLIAEEHGFPEFEVADDGTISGITTIIIDDPKQEPYNGPHVVPCTVQAEDFDDGGEGVAYHDAYETMQNGKTNVYRPEVSVEIENDDRNDGYHLGWTNAGEWVKYTIEVPTAGKYDFTFTWASPNSTSTMTLSVDDVQQKTVAIPNTGAYDRYGEFTIGEIVMTAGKHTVKVELNHGNFDKFRITASPVPIVTVKKEEGGRITVEDRTVFIKGFKQVSSLEILNIIGKKVATATAPKGDMEFRLQRGVYIVRINSDKRPVIQKIIIK
jgi:hypothetical protein